MGLASKNNSFVLLVFTAWGGQGDGPFRNQELWYVIYEQITRKDRQEIAYLRHRQSVV
jgi:hypothetical protein